jgi:hypothetical protein
MSCPCIWSGKVNLNLLDIAIAYRIWNILPEKDEKMHPAMAHKGLDVLYKKNHAINDS